MHVIGHNKALIAVRGVRHGGVFTDHVNKPVHQQTSKEKEKVFEEPETFTKTYGPST